ncbi:MAG: hypothetical protein AB7Q97_13155 [Gammaproteobacteria bacterium]
MKMLVAYSMVSSHVQTTRDYLSAPLLYSGFDVDYLHVTLGARMDASVLEPYQIVFHSYCARLIFDNYVSSDYIEAMRTFPGLKVLAVQDEYDATDKLKAAIRSLGFQIVLTCVPQDELEKVYPKAEFPGVRFHTVYTGYVPDDFVTHSPKIVPLRDRPIRLGYRGRDIGPMYGRLGRDKFEIGARMLEICTAEGLSCDIAMDEKSRIYGTAWFEFIGNCRAMLGTESGSNVFDFDGGIRRRFEEMTSELGRPPTYAEFEHQTVDKDRTINMGQISPRVFECALMRTPMILLRGHYSGALRPGEHYIALEKDYSNATDVLRCLDDFDGLSAMADRTYRHLVASGRFGYRHIWQNLAKMFAERACELARDAAAGACLVQRQDGGSSSEFRDPEHPMFEVPTKHTKSLEDYNRQIEEASKVAHTKAPQSGLVIPLKCLPQKHKIGIAMALKWALAAKDSGRSPTPKGRVLLLAWAMTPEPLRRRIMGRLEQMDCVRERL